ncbi:MAG: HlyD family efflux transporter periplasmic adaptor subunit [Rhizobacter sp.]|nr:HlyD family efflux transporter periplasmic adaptor subunit [Rhizobacter sp.]
MVSVDALPPLRQDLALHAGPAAADGSPTWTLHDPAANRFYELRWAAFEVLSRWSLGSAERVLEAVRRETTLQLAAADLEGLLHMLAHNHLLLAHSAQDSERLHRTVAARRLGPWQWLLKNYLFFRLPLVRPMPWLQRLAPHLRWAYTPGFWAAIALAALLGLGLASRRWDDFTHTFAAYASWSGALSIAMALTLAKVVHELGHAFTAQRYGCRVPTMGVAFLVMWPVLYTDTNEAWKLASRRQRLAIGAAGMLSEIALAAVATLAWAVLPETEAWGPVRAGAFLLATSTWLITVAINASPFMRFDGYFLLSDALNVPNLHDRAFAFGRWWLRERLFGWGDAAPEPVPRARQRFLVAFALATWVYRLVLFVGIALLVYHLFFKALGLLMMAVELGWFIVMPVMRELKVWWARREGLRWNRATRRLAVLLGGAAVVLLWPWESAVRAPAVLGAEQAQGLYAPYAAQVAGPLPAVGRSLRRGEPLVTLHSPDLDARLALARAREQQLQWQLSQQPFDSGLMEAGPALRSRWEAAREEVAGLQRELQRLSLTMPFDGMVVEVSSDAMAGAWVGAGEKLLQVVGPAGAKVDAFVDETQLQRLGAHGSGVFIADTAEHGRVSCKSAAVDAVQLAQLDAGALPLASVYGGSLSAQHRPDGRVLPLQPTFRVRLGDCDAQGAPRHEVTGMALLQGERRSWALEGLRRLVDLLHRETSL